MRGIANRNDEFDLFERMLRGKASHRVLLLEGPSERGKTTLLTEFATLAEEIHGSGCCARIDLKGVSLLSDLYSRLYAELGKGVFTNYSTLQDGHPINLNVDLSGAKLRDGNDVSIKPALHVIGGEARSSHGEAALQDLCVYTSHLVLIIDTFESTTADTSNWIIHQLLPIVRKNKKLYVVLGGKNVPDCKMLHLTLGKLVHHHRLEPIKSVDDWHEFAKTFHPAFPRDQIEILCNGGLTDRPSAISTFIETVARKLPPHNSSAKAS